jgi:site-specific DNA-methyltransferase (adenine-specific)
VSAEPYYRDPEAGIVLYLGDCRSILPELGPVDHVITDPPYSEYVHSKSRRGSDLDDGISRARDFGFDAITPAVMCAASTALARLARRWVLVFSDVESSHRWRGALEKSGLEYARTGAWVKLNPTPQFTGDRPAIGFESVTICHPRGRKRWNGGGRPAVWNHAIVINRSHADPRLHTAQKPLPLMRELVELFTDPGETILDPFAGSGTTGLAAKQLGRKAILIEQSEEYCRVAVERLTVGIPAAKAMARGQAQLL